MARNYGLKRHFTYGSATQYHYSDSSYFIEPPEIFASIIVDLNYASINTIIPLQLDVTYQFNDDLKIQSYDVVFRRWPEAFKYLLPTLAPQIAKELNQTYDAATTNTSQLLSDKVANDVCIVAQQYCVGNNTQYSSIDDCRNFIQNEIPFGDAWEGGLNTGFCRYIHMNMVQYRPDVHCPHVGPTGGDMCIDRDYVQIVNTFPFNSTLIALNTTVTPGDFNGLSTSSVKALIQEGLTLVYPTTVAFYPVPALILFCFLYISSKAVEYGLQLKSKAYRDLSHKNKRNTVSYVLNTFWTTVALGLQLPSAATLGGTFVFTSMQCLKIAGLLVSELYIWELTYRVDMRPSLIIHHFCTLLAMFALFIALENTWHPNLVPAAVIWLFQATTEQSIFIGMIMYRLRFDQRATQRTLKFAAVQSLIAKMVFAIYLLAFWAAKLAKYHKYGTDIFFSVIIVVLLVGLMATQVYGSWAVWGIGRKLNISEKSLSYSPPVEMENGNTVAARESSSSDDDDSVRTLAPASSSYPSRPQLGASVRGKPPLRF